MNVSAGVKTRAQCGQAGARPNGGLAATLQEIVPLVVIHERNHGNLQQLLKSVADALEASSATLFELDDQKARLRCLSSFGRDDAPQMRTGDLERNEQAVEKVFSSGEAYLLSAGTREAGALLLPGTPDGVVSQMIAPLIGGGEPFGLLVVNAGGKKKYRDDDLGTLTVLTAYVAGHLHAIRLQESLDASQANLREQFIRAEKMRTVGEVASGVFHDFNNILGAVIGRIQLLQCKTEDEATSKALAQIERIALQGAETVKRLQEFSRLHQQQEAGPTDLNRVIDDALEFTRHRWETQAQKRGITYDIQRRVADEARVQGIHSQLVDALVNLIRNALDAMEDGGRITFKTACADGVCRLSVADTGPGMTSEQAEQALSAFYTTKGSEGTGLGLTVVRDIVKGHGGTISVQSELGKGTTILIDFPACRGTADADAQALQTDSQAGLRLLVVDDDDIILNVVTEALEDAGHHVEGFKHGTDAIEALGRGSFDVVITDLGMPDVTGWDVARSAKMHEPGLPVVVISGWGAQFTDEQLTDSGIDAMLAKPFHLQMLRDTIERLAQGETTPTKVLTK